MPSGIILAYHTQEHTAAILHLQRVELHLHRVELHLHRARHHLQRAEPLLQLQRVELHLQRVELLVVRRVEKAVVLLAVEAEMVPCSAAANLKDDRTNHSPEADEGASTHETAYASGLGQRRGCRACNSAKTQPLPSCNERSKPVTQVQRN